MQEIFDDSRELQRAFRRQAGLARVMVGISVLVWWAIYFWTISRGANTDPRSLIIQVSVTILVTLLLVASFKWSYIPLLILVVVYGIVSPVSIYALL